MDGFKDIEGAEPGRLLSVSVPGGLHVIGIVASIDAGKRSLTFVGGRTVDFPAEPEPDQKEGDGDEA
ncbi:MAG: hypothetical protein IPP07_29050 [Holophagales bacterium]|jgi:hypothetical protein|nr:hypothetical protein [Holophagales bacterium]